jgi:hypothetical protein
LVSRQHDIEFGAKRELHGTVTIRGFTVYGELEGAVYAV